MISLDVKFAARHESTRVTCHCNFLKQLSHISSSEKKLISLTQVVTSYGHEVREEVLVSLHLFALCNLHCSLLVILAVCAVTTIIWDLRSIKV